MPPKIIYGLYAAYNQRFDDQPADYDKVYIYSTEKELGKIKKRFPFKKDIQLGHLKTRQILA